MATSTGGEQIVDVTSVQTGTNTVGTTTIYTVPSGRYARISFYGISVTEAGGGTAAIDLGASGNARINTPVTTGVYRFGQWDGADSQKTNTTDVNVSSQIILDEGDTVGVTIGGPGGTTTVAFHFVALEYTKP